MLISTLANAQPAELTDSDRKFIDETLARYGSAWSGGLTALGKRFTVRPSKTDSAYALELRSRALDGVTYLVRVGRNGSLSHEGPSMPGRPATEDARRQVDHALKHLGVLWLKDPRGELSEVSLSGGLAALSSVGAVEIREHDKTRLVFVASDPPWVLGFGEDGAFLGCSWVDLAAVDARVLTEKELDFFDASFAKNGDFNVYGRVTGGLRALVRDANTTVRLDETKNFRFSITPRDGHGHRLSFTVDSTGKISSVAAGHVQRAR